MTAAEIEPRLRALDPPIIARIHDDRLVLDLRTVSPEQDETIGEALNSIW
jgi:L-seryl-tRNA(Ser) seleniumtransferase